MRKSWLFWLSSTASVLLIALLTLYGCGGEGGPIAPPPEGGVSPSRQFLDLLPEAQRDATYVGSQRCGTSGCHESKFTNWSKTHHAQVNVGCEQCHGPGSKHVDKPSEENILTGPKSQSPIVCAQCHGPIYEQWAASKHSQIVRTPVERAVENPGLYGKICMHCHSGLFRHDVTDAGIDFNAMPNEQIIQIAQHTLDLVPYTASCATCHSPHKQTGNLTDDGKEVQLRHAVFNTDTSQIGPGATVDQYVHFNHICAQCHNGRGANPSDAALERGTARPNMHDSNQFNMLMGIGGVEGSGPVQRNTAHAKVPGQCSHCHMPDSRHTFTVSFDKGCVPCHTAADAAERTRAVKSEILSALYALRTRMERWANDTFGDPALWDYTALLQEEGKTPPNQSQVPIQVKRARHNYYFVLRDACFGPHNAPYIRHLINIANQNLDQIGVSRGRVSTRVKEAYIRSVLEADLHRAQAAARRE